MSAQERNELIEKQNQAVIDNDLQLASSIECFFEYEMEMQQISDYESYWENV